MEWSKESRTLLQCLFNNTVKHWDYIHRWHTNVCLWITDRIIRTGEAEVDGEEFVLMTICPPQIARGLAWDRIWVSAMKDQWLTAGLTTGLGSPVKLSVHHSHFAYNGQIWQATFQNISTESFCENLVGPNYKTYWLIKSLKVTDNFRSEILSPEAEEWHAGSRWRLPTRSEIQGLELLLNSETDRNRREPSWPASRISSWVYLEGRGEQINPHFRENFKRVAGSFVEIRNWQLPST